MSRLIKLTGGWKQFKTTDGRQVRFFVPLGVRRKRGFCPKCKVYFTLCPFEEKLPIYHHFFCASKCRIKIGMCGEPDLRNSCGAEIHKRIPRCKSCLFFRKGYGGYCSLDPNLIIQPITEACEGYVCRTWRKA